MNRLTYSPPTGYAITQTNDKRLKHQLARPESAGSFNNLTFPHSISKLRPVCTYGGDSLRFLQAQKSQDGKPSRPAFTRIFEGPIDNSDSGRPKFSLECPEESSQMTPDHLQEDEFSRIDGQLFLPRALSFYGRGNGNVLQRLNSRRMSRSLPELREYKIIPLPSTDETEQESDEDEDYVYEAHNKSNWHRNLDLILCVVCQTLGLNSLWRFPYYCYKNGGGSFLLAYLILLLLCGIPLLCMELAVGQITQNGPIAALGQLCPLMKGVGFSSIMASFLLTSYYSVLVGWTLFYLFNSFFSLPRWVTCKSAWNTEQCWDAFISFQPLGDNEKETYSTSLGDNGITSISNTTILNVENASIASLEDLVTFVTSTFVPAKENALIQSESTQNHTLSSQEFFDWKLISLSGGIEKLGDLRFELMAAVLFTWILVYFALRKATFFKGRTVYILSITCHVVLLSLFVRMFFLEGSLNGLHYLFKPHWETLGTAKIWLYALVQVFHSLGIVLGSSIAVGSFNKQQNNIYRDTVILAVTTVVSVVIISCIVFGTIGHLSAMMEQPIHLVLHEDPGLPFVIYSVVIGTMPVPSLWGTFFFIMFFWLGMEYQAKLIAVIVTSLEESYSHFIKHKFQGHSLFLFIVCIIGFLSSFLYFTQAGIYFFQVTDFYIAVLLVPVIAVLETSTISWIYGTSKLCSSISENIGKKPSVYFRTCWIFISPLVFVAILILSIADMAYLGNDIIWSRVGKGVGWFLFSFTLCWILIIGANTFRKTPKANFFIRIQSSIEPKQHPEPLHLWDPKPLIVLNAVPYVGNEDEEEQLPELFQQAAPFLASKNARETAI